MTNFLSVRRPKVCRRRVNLPERPRHCPLWLPPLLCFPRRRRLRARNGGLTSMMLRHLPLLLQQLRRCLRTTDGLAVRHHHSRVQLLRCRPLKADLHPRRLPASVGPRRLIPEGHFRQPGTCLMRNSSRRTRRLRSTREITIRILRLRRLTRMRSNPTSVSPVSRRQHLPGLL